MKIVFMGTPDFALPTLKKLAASAHQILSVVTQPDRPKGRGREVSASPVKRFALASGFPVLQPEKANTPEFVATLKEMAPDVAIVVAFGQILSQDLLDVPRFFCINLHASLLPKYRGAAPIHRAIIDGESETGVTTMKMDAGMDTGDILLTRSVPISDTDTSQTLHDVLSEEGASLVLETLRLLEAGSLTPLPQDSTLATYAPKLKKEDGLIPWDQTACAIRNQVRGLDPWPGAYTFFAGKRLRVCRAETAPGVPNDKPGTVARVTDHAIEVGTGDGRLLVTELQPEGKKRMLTKSFLAGHRIESGAGFDRNPSPATPTQ